MTGLRVIAFEPYDGGSHRAVRESISRHSRHRWTWYTAPPRAWKWRMRLGALDLVRKAKAGGAFDEPCDVIFATSLLSLADLVAALPRSHRGTPTVLYMHENQAAYPRGHESERRKDERQRDVHFALTNLTSVRCADVVVWNSAWNQRSFREGIERIVMHAPEPGLRSTATTGGANREDHEVVIWPPVEPPPPEIAVTAGGRILHNPARVVWPHRWEHDKGPRELLEIARRDTRRLGLRWTILGEQFRRTPPDFAKLEKEFAEHIDAIGFEDDRGSYWSRLAACDWVLSTAHHEFFGIAVVEAMLAGCLPWLPDRLSYPELLPEIARGLSPDHPPSNPGVVRRIRAHLEPAIATNAVSRIDAIVEQVAG